MAEGDEEAERRRAQRERDERANRALRASAARVLVRVRERTGRPIPEKVRRWAAEPDDYDI